MTGGMGKPPTGHETWAYDSVGNDWYTASVAFVTGTLQDNGTGLLSTTGSIEATLGFTGSLTQLPGGAPYIVGVGAVSISTGSNGQIVISGSGGSGGSTVTNVTASGGVTVSQVGTVFTVSSSLVTVAGSGGISVKDGGGSTYTVSSSIVSVTGAGATTVTDGGGTTYVVSSSGSPVTSVLGEGGSSVIQSNTTFTVSSSLVTVTGTGGTTVADGGGSTYTVSSSQGVLSVVTQGGTAATIAGSALTISSSIVSVTGAGATSVTDGGGTTYVVSSSAGVLSVIAQGGTAASIAGTALIVSSSIVTAAGIGGTSVTDGGGTSFIVSSSIGAFASASFIVAGVDAENPNERRLVGKNAVQTIDNGPGSTFVLLVTGTLEDNGTGQLSTTGSILATMGFTGSLTQVSPGNPFLVAGSNVSVSVNPTNQWVISSTGGGGGGGGSGADPYASYIVVAATGSLANDRMLVGRDAVKIIDNGPGNSIVLLVTGTLQDDGTGTLLYTTSSISAAGLTGSLTEVSVGSPYLLAGPGISLATNSLGQVVINNAGASFVEWDQDVDGQLSSNYSNDIIYDGPTDPVADIWGLQGTTNTFFFNSYLPVNVPFVTIMSNSGGASAIDAAVGLSGSSLVTYVGQFAPVLLFSDGKVLTPSYVCPGGDQNFGFINYIGGGAGSTRYVNSLGIQGGSFFPSIPIYGTALNPQDIATFSYPVPTIGMGPSFSQVDTLLWQVKSPGGSPVLFLGWQGQSVTGGSTTIVPEVFYPGTAWISQFNGEQVVRIADAITGPSTSVQENVEIPSTANGTTTTLTVELTAKISFSDGTGSDVLGDSCYGSFVGTFTNISDNVTQLGTMTNLVAIANSSSTSMSDMTLAFGIFFEDTVSMVVTSGASIGPSSQIALQLKITAEIN